MEKDTYKTIVGVAVSLYIGVVAGNIITYGYNALSARLKMKNAETDEEKEQLIQEFQLNLKEMGNLKNFYIPFRSVWEKKEPLEPIKELYKEKVKPSLEGIYEEKIKLPEKYISLNEPAIYPHIEVDIN